AVVGLGFPERFALGAATGTFAAFINARLTGCSGMRTPTVDKPAETFAAKLSFFKGRITVSGPGQNFSMSWMAFGG
ncbi:conserved hypothetical protein, partial [Listeria monocytogenes FSL F2-208]